VRTLLAQSDTSASAPLLLTAARVLLARLHEAAGLSLGPDAGGADPLAFVRLPSKCLDLLRGLLDVFAAGRQSPDVRAQARACGGGLWRSRTLAPCPRVRRATRARLIFSPSLPPFRSYHMDPYTPVRTQQVYAALLQYLQFCRSAARPGGGAPAPVLAALLSGLLGPGGAASAAGRLDAAQDALERGNAALLGGHRQALVAALAGDALRPPAAHVAPAICAQLLAALLATGAGAEFAGACYAAGVPRAILSLLVTGADRAITAPLQSAQARARARRCPPLLPPLRPPRSRSPLFPRVLCRRPPT
jgi:hypothetical protein